MEPRYMNENRYSHLVGKWKKPATVDYEVETPETEFEWRVQSLFMEEQTYLHQEKFVIAMQSFRELMALILYTANPEMPIDPNQILRLEFPNNVVLIDTLTTKTAEILQKSSINCRPR